MALSAGSAQAGTGLAGLMKTKLLSQQPITKDEQMTWDTLDALAEAIVEHIVNNLEIKGITISLDDVSTLPEPWPPGTGRIVEGFVAGVGTHGGTLAGSGPVTGAVLSDKESVGTQNNDGMGLVA